MKNTWLLSLILALLVVSCETTTVEQVEEDPVIVGGVYTEYTDLIGSACQTQIIINDSSYAFNQVDAIYASIQPTFEMNNFYLIFSNTNGGEWVELELLTPLMAPEAFFKKGELQIDTVFVNGSLMVDDYYNINGVLTWDSVSYSGFSFAGSGKFELPSEFDGTYSGINFPGQTIEFEFK